MQAKQNKVKVQTLKHNHTFLNKKQRSGLSIFQPLRVQGQRLNHKNKKPTVRSNSYQAVRRHLKFS